jgi:hypothetical protein
MNLAHALSSSPSEGNPANHQDPQLVDSQNASRVIKPRQGSCKMLRQALTSSQPDRTEFCPSIVLSVGSHPISQSNILRKVPGKYRKVKERNGRYFFESAGKGDETLIHSVLRLCVEVRQPLLAKPCQKSNFTNLHKAATNH